MSRNSLRIMPGAVVCTECELRGEITIGAGTLIHPKARIIAEGGPIYIGNYNLIEEQCEIINEKSTSGGNDSVLIIGNQNVFDVGSKCHSLKVGDNNVFEAKSYVGREVEVTNGCIIGATCRITGQEVLPELTVLYGGEFPQRRIAGERPPAQTLQLDFLTKILPNYHHLRKASKSAASAAASAGQQRS